MDVLNENNILYLEKFDMIKITDKANLPDSFEVALNLASNKLNKIIK